METAKHLDSGEPISIYNVHDGDIQFAQPLLPSLVVRVKAFFVDLLILLVVFATISVIIDTVGGVPSWVKGSIAVFMFYLYDPIFTAYTGGLLVIK